MFRRRRRADPDEPLEAVAEVEPEPQPEPAREPERPAGPWDRADLPADEVTRLDLGGLQVPVLEGLEIRVEVGAEQEVTGATLVAPDSALALSAFAAPRREGLWDEIRAEIVAALESGGGSADETQGPFGPELSATVPSDGSGGRPPGLAPARFVGVDGPRWFLRGVFTGVAAVDPEQAVTLEEAFRLVVVDRGSEAMAPRDPLPMRLPREAVEAAAGPGLPAGPADEDAGEEEDEDADYVDEADDDDDDDDANDDDEDDDESEDDGQDDGGAGRRTVADLNPFERGPEITEVR